jgi:hypothetical protein
VRWGRQAAVTSCADLIQSTGILDGLPAQSCRPRLGAFTTLTMPDYHGHPLQIEFQGYSRDRADSVLAAFHWTG